jgi:adenylate cyclase
MRAPSKISVTDQPVPASHSRAGELDTSAAPAPRETTVLFAAVTGNSGLYESARDGAAAEALSKCLEVVRGATETNGGRVVKTIGDELMTVFPDPDSATTAATHMHLAVNALPAVEGHKLALRIGFHAGPVLQRDGDIFGDTVNLASRLTAHATKGQVLTSADTVTKLTAFLRNATRRLYDIAVKGKAQDVSLCEVLWAKDPDITDVTLRSDEQPARGVRLRLRVGTREWVRRRRVELITIGRDPESTLVIAEATASRNHCVIERRQNRFVIRDHSSNGTFILLEGDKKGIVLRREEFLLQGHGWISFGQPKSMATEVAEFFCEEDPRARSANDDRSARTATRSQAAARRTPALTPAKVNQYLDAVKTALHCNTDTELASKLRVLQSRISNYRTGRTLPDMQMARRIANVLNLRPSLVVCDIRKERALRRARLLGSLELCEET